MGFSLLKHAASKARLGADAVILYTYVKTKSQPLPRGKALNCPAEAEACSSFKMDFVAVQEGFFSSSSSLYTGLSLLWPLPLRSRDYRRAGSAAWALGPIHSRACWNLPVRGTNSCLLHRQPDPPPLRHRGSPTFCIIVTLAHISGHIEHSRGHPIPCKDTE